MKIHKSDRKVARVFSWIARSIGLLIILVFVFIGIGNLTGEEDPYAVGDLDPTQMYPTLIVISIWIIFFIIGWFNELVGLIGTIFWPFIWGLEIFYTSGSNQFIAATLIPSPLLLTGLFFLIAYIIDKQSK
jgi:hypothetical protein